MTRYCSGGGSEGGFGYGLWYLGDQSMPMQRLLLAGNGSRGLGSVEDRPGGLPWLEVSIEGRKGEGEGFLYPFTF